MGTDALTNPVIGLSDTVRGLSEAVLRYEGSVAGTKTDSDREVISVIGSLVTAIEHPELVEDGSTPASHIAGSKAAVAAAQGIRASGPAHDVLGEMEGLIALIESELLPQ